jgi:hypothetical protein
MSSGKFPNVVQEPPMSLFQHQNCAHDVPMTARLCLQLYAINVVYEKSMEVLRLVCTEEDSEGGSYGHERQSVFECPKIKTPATEYAFPFSLDWRE